MRRQESAALQLFIKQETASHEFIPWSKIIFHVSVTPSRKLSNVVCLHVVLSDRGTSVPYCNQVAHVFYLLRPIVSSGSRNLKVDFTGNLSTC